MASVKPVLQALVLADRVYEDKATNKKIIAGTFNRLFFSKKDPQQVVEDADGKKTVRIPGGLNSGSPSVYINLTDVHGRVPFTLQYVDLRDHRVLLSTQFAVECKNPLVNVEVVLPLPMLPAPHAGTYALELLSDSHPIGSLRVEAVSLDGDGEDQK